MKHAIRPALAVLVSVAVMSLAGAIGQTRNWPWLGVIITDITSGNVEGYRGGGSGSYVTGIEKPGPAFDAGLLRHDIIIAVDGKTALNTRELTCIIQGKRPGDIVSVTVMRAGQRHSVTARLGTWPVSSEFPRPHSGNCGRDAVSDLTDDQSDTVAALLQRRVMANAASAGTPNTMARNGSSPTTE